MNEITNQEWYTHLVGDCKAIVTEAVFTSRWALVEGYWHLGERVRNDLNWQKYQQGLESSQDLANDIGLSERTLDYALQTYDKYPQLENIPDGKNISWSKLITQYLTSPKNETPPPPEGKFDVIYADPPWKYDIDLAHTRSPENHYPVMDLAEMVAFPHIRNASAENCTLFMWTTAPKLNWMNDVLSAWGFEYKTNLIWDKVKHNMGHYSSVRHEILVIAGKGMSAPVCDGETIQSIDSVQSIDKSTTHSQKPIEFYEIIEKLYPNKKYIEFFARSLRPGWVSWGNEV